MPGQVKRLVILDALRAIAGLTVPLFHICEPFTYRAGVKIESYCGHGYLAVEFFLLLMGYMLGFAYDRRWADGMGLGSFFRRRLVRLHPLVVSGVLIGIITEYYTSTDYKPTQKLAEMATEGEAFVITKGDAIGSRSCLLPILLIGISLFASGAIAGTYGIAVASLGMLAFVGATVSIDAFGPIADNAGGISEACHLPEEVREITDKLDAVGNTTAAIGKGFAIGSAAFATVSLIVAYVENCNFGDFSKIALDFADYVVVAGGIIGGALVEYFSALLTDNTIEAARKMADEGDKILTAKPGVLDENNPEKLTTEDYNSMIKLATSEALGYMLLPSVMALLIPIVGGFIFGVKFVGGLLVGATVVAIPRAIFMGNSGGAFDNAKKYIEGGNIAGHGKGSAAHKASVAGDTVGDTRKDVVGVALDIFIKTMSTVANTLAVVIRSIRG